MRVQSMISAACVLALLATPIAVRPALARGGFRVCNQTSEKLYVAIAYFSGDRDFFVSEGWWTLTPGSCTRVFPNRSYDGHRYYYAQNETKSTQWISDNGPEVCIDPHNRFAIAHADGGSTCSSPYVRQKFHFFSDNDLNLTPSGTPGPGGQPQPSGGPCLRAVNVRDNRVSFTVDGWPGVHWVVEEMDPLFPSADLMRANGAPIRSSTGRYSLRGYNGSDVSNAAWTFDPNYAQYGCNGAWTVTFK